MNILIVRPDEIVDRVRARISGPRARHLTEVMKLEPGSRLRVGLPDGPRGEAEVLEVGAEVLLRHELAPEAPSADPAPIIDVLLALPRPKVLARLLSDLAAFGVGRIVLVRSWRVEKSYFQTDELRPEVARESLLRGLEQGRGTRLPELSVEPLFRPFVEDRLDALAPARRLVAQPAVSSRARDLSLRPDERVMLAIGPEGGWLPFEVELLEKQGFEAVALTDRTLRVEPALHFALGALERARRSPAN